MATLKGKSVVFGSNGLTFAGTIDGTTQGSQATVESIGLLRDSQKVEILDDQGAPAGQVFYAKKKTLNITVQPYDDTGDGDTSTIGFAETSLSAWSLLSGGTVSIVDARGAVIDDQGSGGTMNSDIYNIMTSSARRQSDGIALVDLVLEAFDETDTSTAVS